METDPARGHDVAPPPPPPSAFRRMMGFLAGHPIGVLQTLFFVLVAIVVLQNLEPTTLDVLFWSIPGLPKLVMLLAAMIVGALVWEVLRRRLFRS